MTREEAIVLINELVSAEVEVMKQMNSRGRVTKVAEFREKAAVAVLFSALTDNEHPTPKEILEMTGV